MGHAMLTVLSLVALLHVASADDVVPHHQDRPPGPPLSPTEAMAKMTVPEGFRVELVAAEPDIVNPVAMTFDEQGRVWITESLEYPRMEAGPGRDRIKVLEDTTGDGKADRVSIFAEGFNIPSGIAVGYGGVWLANAPDILFLQDTDGDGHADKREVVVTGFGRDDTHELPNSLTWGPDGWLYGLNGVFNASTIEQNGKKHEFTCALFRIHPRTREFQLFAEGTSNPWGIAWDPEGNAFISACVIDHLWHLAEGGYYIRQGGPYPPFVDPMRSIVDHKHQKAAYCGIHYFDSDAYPEPFRDRLYMGNIHGNCINVDVLSRNGSTYAGAGEPDFLTANDAWFMPVVQKTGPDGCLYVLDWYDRYHCYQDARRDPEGIDRLKGRLYRIRYKDSPRAGQFNLAEETDAELLKRLESPNVYYRDVAQRVLAERNDPETRPKLAGLALDANAPRKTRLHALWALIGGGPLTVELHQSLLRSDDPGFRAWGVRAAGNAGTVDPTVRSVIRGMTDDPAPEVRLQVATAARKIEGLDPVPMLLDVLSHSAGDALIRHIVWQNLHPVLEQHGERFFRLASTSEQRESADFQWLFDHAIDRVLAGRSAEPVLALVEYAAQRPQDQRATLARCFERLAAKAHGGTLSDEQCQRLRTRLQPIVDRLLRDEAKDDALRVHVALLAGTWRDATATPLVRAMYRSDDGPVERRAAALRTLIVAGDGSLRADIQPLFAGAQPQPVQLRRAAIESLGQSDADWVADLLLANYEKLEPELRPKAVALLCERRRWAEQLLDAIGNERVPTSALNTNQVRQLLVGADSDLTEKVTAIWGSLREQRDPAREQVISQMRSFLRNTPGDPVAGQAVYKRVCGQCHKLHGAGEEVGPDITLNGRNSFEQLLSNVFDPSLVIGASYQARTVVTGDGRVLTGLVAEDSPERVVLKVQGGKQEVVARDDIELMKTSELSLMPEDLEKQLKPQEMADLFALLTLDKPPSDPTARRLPGSQPVVPRETRDRAAATELAQYVAAGFAVQQPVRPRVALVGKHGGREGVLRTDPNCILTRTIDVPAGQRARLVVDVSHAPEGAWQLGVQVDGKRLATEQIGDEEADVTWETLSFDLTDPAGQNPVEGETTVELMHMPRTGKRQSAYWGRVEIITE